MRSEATSGYNQFPKLHYNVPDREISFQGQNKYTTGLMVTGVLHILLAFSSVILGVAAIGMMAWFSYLAIPIWTGLLFFVTSGVLGILSAFSKRKPLKVAYLIMCIVSTFFAVAIVVLYSLLAIAEYTSTHEHYPVCSPGLVWYDPCFKNRSGRRAIDILIALIAFAETIVCIVGSTFACCKSCDCCEPCCRLACGCCLNCCNPPPLYARQIQNGTGYQEIGSLPSHMLEETTSQRGQISSRHSNASPATIQSENLFVVQTSQWSSRSPSPYSAGRTDLTNPPHETNLGFENEGSPEDAGPVPEQKD